ncbi:hypothetical protein ACFVUW_10740 [Streptomyces xiamenensis]|uniref:hypothetical protein n=1 Tax=Streptomyces xiamenensis TaxID=408015 RepID=UPI0036F06C9E
MNVRLLGELASASSQECTSCVHRLLEDVAADSACLGRLVELSLSVILEAFGGELPAFLREESGAGSQEFRILLLALAREEPLSSKCEAMSAQQRRDVASHAFDVFVVLTTALCGGDQGPGRASAAGRRLPFPDVGYREDPPLEGPPADRAKDHTWQISIDRILLLRWDTRAAQWNETNATSLTIGERTFVDTTGLEALACPECYNQDNWLAEGQWGDPLTLYCRCGVAIESPHEGPLGDLGRWLLQRLILSEADPAYVARRLMPQVAQHKKRQAAALQEHWYVGPEEPEVQLVAAIDLDSTSDLAASLTAALRPKLPARHAGRALTLLLLQVAHALSSPHVRDTADGQRLACEVRELLTDLRSESDRWAEARRPLLEHLQAIREQDENLPQKWRDAWGRVLNIVGRRLAHLRVGDGTLVDGCTALALALYILPERTPVEDVHVEDVSALLPSRTLNRTGPTDAPRRWGAGLQRLGHNLDDLEDPIVASWQRLSADRATGLLLTERAPALVVGLDALLNTWDLRF